MEISLDLINLQMDMKSKIERILNAISREENPDIYNSTEGHT
jgi:hypothetical protein